MQTVNFAQANIGEEQAHRRYFNVGDQKSGEGKIFPFNVNTTRRN